jgi:hypothetical protein
MDEDEARRLALEDGYVTCDECGDRLEDHNTTGCQAAREEPCTCSVRITQAEIRTVRRRYGLPAQFDRRTLMP